MSTTFPANAGTQSLRLHGGGFLLAYGGCGVRSALTVRRESAAASVGAAVVSKAWRHHIKKTPRCPARGLVSRSMNPPQAQQPEPINSASRWSIVERPLLKR
jgi:hypothetical protein